MQSVSFRIWTRIAVSISYDDNHYTTDTSLLKNIIGSDIKFYTSCYLSDTFMMRCEAYDNYCVIMLYGHLQPSIWAEDLSTEVTYNKNLNTL